MATSKKDLITILIALSFLYFILFKPIVNIIDYIATPFSPDYNVQAHTLIVLYFLGFIDLITLSCIIYFFSKKEKLNKKIRFILFLVILEVATVNLIAVFDRSCNTESYALKYVTALSLLAVSALSVMSSRNFADKKIKIFWYISSLAFLYAFMDELFSIHEGIEKMAIKMKLVDESSIIIHTIPILYLTVGIICILFFYKSIKKEYFKKGRSKWLYLLLFGLAAHGAAAIIDSATTACMEEYLETFASFMYLLAVYVQYKEIKK